MAVFPTRTVVLCGCEVIDGAIGLVTAVIRKESSALNSLWQTSRSIGLMPPALATLYCQKDQLLKMPVVGLSLVGFKPVPVAAIEKERG